MKHIAFLGDSITCGYGLEDKSRQYATLVSEALGMNEENYGITGTLVAKAGLNRENDNAYVTRIHLIDSADVAVVFGGTNDYFWSDREIDGEGAEYFSDALEQMIARIRRERSGKVTLFVTPYPHNGVGNYCGGADWKASSRHDTDAVNYNGHVLQDYVRAIVAACERNGMPCLNLHEDFPFDWRVHTMDGCHPNEEGHRLLADAIVHKLMQLTAGQF